MPRCGPRQRQGRRQPRNPIRGIFACCCASTDGAGVSTMTLSANPKPICLLDCDFPDYRITLSARTNTLGGIVRPICLAVFELTMNLNFINCSTGKSAGLVPPRRLEPSASSCWPQSRRHRVSTGEGKLPVFNPKRPHFFARNDFASCSSGRSVSALFVSATSFSK